LAIQRRFKNRPRISNTMIYSDRNFINIYYISKRRTSVNLDGDHER
jgi:hypothetical protein